MQKQSPLFVGLDIGTSAVRCVVGKLDTEEHILPTIIGAGVSPNRGMRKGSVIHVEEVVTAVSQALSDAERISGTHVTSVTTNINGNHLIGINSKGVVAISNANKEITVDDKARAEEAATVVQLPANREILQVFARNYHVDGQENIKDPVGMQGVRLEVDTHIVTTATPPLRIVEQVLERCRIGVNNITVSGFAAAEAVLSRDQKESGTVLVDIGAGTTNVVVFEEAEVQHVAVIPMGGQHITNDLAIGLKTDIPIAERVKLEHADARGTKAGPRDILLTTRDEERLRFERTLINDIVQARVEEIFDTVERELRKIGRSRKLPGGVVLTGGSAKLTNIAELAKDFLELPARVSQPASFGGVIDTTHDPAFATAAGLMLLDMAAGHQHGYGQQNSVMLSNKFMQSLTNLLRRR